MGRSSGLQDRRGGSGQVFDEYRALLGAIRKRERVNVKIAIAMDPKDNVATLLSAVDKNEMVRVRLGDKSTEQQIKEGIRFGHKFALERIRKGRNVVKYGEVIGRATRDIDEGHHVHVHNVESLRGRGDQR
jgi:altronate dehydratase small subunit